jgi:ubiquinone/menaquinone biosynthesis C-methylase UbiE
MSTVPLDVEEAVRSRYSAAAERPIAELCCPTRYDPALLEAIPREVRERDYGCGNPAQYLRAGDTVLDLGSGSGTIAFIASQVVGPAGRVVGVDSNDRMLAVARKAAPEVARRTGFANVTFRKGRIQDLALDLERLDQRLAARPVRSADDLAALEADVARWKASEPLVVSDSVDVVVSNCVLNLVRPEDKVALFREIHRVLQRGGNAVISDIVSAEDVPESLMRDPELWTGCISGALREERFLASFEEAGLYGVTLLECASEPWRTVDGIEFRSVVVAAYKGKEGPCLDRKQAVIYKGPFRQVVDDDGHLLRRGVRMAVCAKTFEIFARAPYREHVELVEPREEVAPEAAAPFPCHGEPPIRDPRETKGEGYRDTRDGPGCGPDGTCC